MDIKTQYKACISEDAMAFSTVLAKHQLIEPHLKGFLTERLWQQVLDELGVIPHVQDAVHTGVHELLLVITQVAGHVLGDEDDPPFTVHDKEEAIQCL